MDKEPIHRRLDDPEWVDEVLDAAKASTATADTESKPSVDNSGGESLPVNHDVVDRIDPVASGAEPDSLDIRRKRIEWAFVIGGALVLALLIRSFWLQSFLIPSASMESTLEPGSRVLVNKLANDINRFDVVVFRSPETERESQQGSTLIKRVVGLSGEMVEIRNQVVYVDGLPLDEPYVDADWQYADMEATEVPRGHVFVLGDNRPTSRDSRVFGPVPNHDIIGRAFLKIWPPGSAGLL